MITRIVFDSERKPTFVKVDTGKFMHAISELYLKIVEFSEDEKRWFRKPITR